MCEGQVVVDRKELQCGCNGVLQLNSMVQAFRLGCSTAAQLIYGLVVGKLDDGVSEVGLKLENTSVAGLGKR